MATKLQEPKYLYMRGGLRPWKEGVLHVGSEAVLRCVNAFEGLKGYWQPNGPFGVVNVKEHYDRLCRSARLLHIPYESSLEHFQGAIGELAAELLDPNRDMWFRATLFAVEGHWGENTVADLVITAYHQDKKPPDPIHLGVSTWRRGTDVSLPPRIKTGANYQVARIARIEGRAHGCQDMVLLNHSGRVAEATGSCIVVVRDGVVYTPPATEGALESITLDIVEALAKSENVPFVRRPIDRTELVIADEIALVGTLAELIIVESFEGHALNPESPILRSLQDRYFRAVRNIDPHPAVRLTVLEHANSTVSQ